MIERLGFLLGWGLAPLFAAGGWLRGGRLLHPRGLLWRATVLPAAEDGDEGLVARSLAGPAFVRLSGAWWKRGREGPDLLGAAVRFVGGRRPDLEPGPSDQNLLFATARSPWLLLLGVLETDAHDFLANTYRSLGPLDVGALGRGELRLVPERPGAAGATRAERLRRTVHEGRASLRLDFRRRGGPWRPLVRVRLEAELPRAQAPSFQPFLSGRGIEPRGFVNALRLGVYALSAALRLPAHAQAPARPPGRPARRRGAPRGARVLPFPRPAGPPPSHLPGS